MRRTVMTGIGILALAAGSAPGQPDTSVDTIRRYRQLQQYAQQQAGPLEIDGQPVTLRATGASLQVYLGDQPYPESRMKWEDTRTLLLDSDGAPAGQMLIEGQRVRLAPVGEGQPAEGRLLIGVSLSPVDSTLAGHLGIEAEGASLISSVTEGWPAAEAGLQSGDIIVSVEGKDEGTSEALRSAIAEREAGDELEVTVISGGERKDVTITLSDEARASTAFGVATMISPAGEYDAAGRLVAPDVTRLATGDYYGALAQRGQWQQQAQRAQELRAATESRLRRTDQAADSAAGRASEQAEAEARRARERVAVVERQNDWAIAGSDGARVTVDIPAGGGRAVVAPGAQSDIARRLSALEERMTRIEALLQQIAEKSGAR